MKITDLNPLPALAVMTTLISGLPIGCGEPESGARKPPPPAMNETNLIQKADEQMRSDKPAEALKSYQSASEQSRTNLNEKQKVWLLLSIANAAIRKGDHAEALDALAALQERYADTGIVVGNPLFASLPDSAFKVLTRIRKGRRTTSPAP